MNNIMLIGISIFFSAFFSGMEIAFISSNKLKIELDRKRGSFSAKLLAHFVKIPSKLIATILVANNIALVIYGVGMAIILEPIIIGILPEILISDFTIMIGQTIVSTLVILFLAEFLPKALFRISPNYVLQIFAIPLFLFYYLLYPFAWIFIESSEFILHRVFKVKSTDNKQAFSFVDLDDFINEFSGEKETVNEESPEIQMFQNAIDFRNIKLRECMIPRTEIVAAEKEESIQELQRTFIDTGLSKILIFDETIDTIIGYLHASELFKNPKKIKNVIKPVLLVPESMPANLLLSKFIHESKSVAVVVDEFGGTSGMLTMEDVIEEIFGEIQDEFDTEVLVDRKISDFEYIFSGRIEIDHINEKHKLNITESDDYETLAGFIISHTENIPVLNAKIAIEQFTFYIIEVSAQRIEKVRLKVKN